jgi:hypothetical protein
MTPLGTSFQIYEHYQLGRNKEHFLGKVRSYNNQSCYFQSIDIRSCTRYFKSFMTHVWDKFMFSFITMYIMWGYLWHVLC